MPPPRRGECATTVTPIRPGSSIAGPAPPASPWTATRGGFGAWRIRPASATLLRRQIKGRSAAAGACTNVVFGTIVTLPGSRSLIYCSEYYDLGSHEIGIRHWKVAAEGGSQPSIDALKKIYNIEKPGKEFITKEYLDSAYRACYEA